MRLSLFFYKLARDHNMVEEQLSDRPECLPEPVKFIPARCRTSSGKVSDIAILDLSVAGCLVDTRSLLFRPEERVLVKLPGLGFLPAHVIWAENERAGLEFEELLYEPVLEHLQRSFTT